MTSEALFAPCRATAIALLVAAPIVAAACDSRSPVSSSGVPGTPAVPPPTVPSESSPRYHLSGRVVTDRGAPLAGAVVEVDHGRPVANNGTSFCPPSFARYCWQATETNGNGEYAFDFEAELYNEEHLGYVYSFADGYETVIQWVPGGSTTPVLNRQLRPLRPIRPGETSAVRVEPTDSLCTDLEDHWALEYRCEVVYVEVSREGTLRIEARDTAGRPVEPEAFFFATSGNYDGGWTRVDPSTLSSRVRPGVFLVFVGIPEGTAARRLDIVTSLQ